MQLKTQQQSSLSQQQQQQQQQLANRIQQAQKQPNYVAIIVCAGEGSRFGGDLPKQYCCISTTNKPLVALSIDTFLTIKEIAKIIVVVKNNDPYIDYIITEAGYHRETHDDNKVIIARVGGKMRAHSVFNGLEFINTYQPSLRPEWVLVHDAVRPLITSQSIMRLINEVTSSYSCSGVVGGALSLEVVDSVRRRTASTQTFKVINRDGLYLMQSPQMAHFTELYLALQKSLTTACEITDEMGALISCDKQVIMVRGDRDNIKVTTKEDLAFVNKLYLSNLNNLRNLSNA